MTLEMSMRQDVVKALKSLHAISIENSCGVGTPDVNYSGGWIELKAMPYWPVGEYTPLRISHYTNEQRIWAIKRTKSGGRCDLLLKVGTEWFCFDGAIAARHLGKTHRERLISLAAYYWPRTPTNEELLQCFTPTT